MGPAAEIVAAVDVSPVALAVYRHNFPHPTVAALVEFLTEERLERFEADLWWLSPPCQPYTRRGKQQDLDDPRAASFPFLLKRIAAIRPRYLALENVPAFEGSHAHRLLITTLEQAGYSALVERHLCPSEFKIPNRRQRYYLVASRGCLAPLKLPSPEPLPLRDFLDPEPDPSLEVSQDLLKRYLGALHILDAEDPQAVASCFTAAYGRSAIRSGSYLRTSAGARRFSPREILSILGFPPSFALPNDLTRRKSWHLVGNSLSLPPVRAMLSTVPEFSVERQIREP
jgi:site-specific DNA-cytosine methylase